MYSTIGNLKTTFVQRSSFVLLSECCHLLWFDIQHCLYFAWSRFILFSRRAWPIIESEVIVLSNVYYRIQRGFVQLNELFICNFFLWQLLVILKLRETYSLTFLETLMKEVTQVSFFFFFIGLKLSLYVHEYSSWIVNMEMVSKQSINVSVSSQYKSSLIHTDSVCVLMVNCFFNSDVLHSL